MESTHETTRKLLTSYRVFKINCVFPQLTATHPLHVEVQPFIARYLSVQRWHAIFCTTNSSPLLASKGEVGKFLKFYRKNTIFSEQPEGTLFLFSFFFLTSPLVSCASSWFAQLKLHC